MRPQTAHMAWSASTSYMRAGSSWRVCRWAALATLSVMWHKEPARKKSFSLTGSTRDRTVSSVYKSTGK